MTNRENAHGQSAVPTRQHVRVLHDGVIPVDYGERPRITVSGVQAANKAQRDLSSEPPPVLVCGRQLVSVDEDAMGYCSHPDIAEVTAAMALVVHSLLARHLGALFLSYSQAPPFTGKTVQRLAGSPPLAAPRQTRRRVTRHRIDCPSVTTPGACFPPPAAEKP